MLKGGTKCAAFLFGLALAFEKNRASRFLSGFANFEVSVRAKGLLQGVERGGVAQFRQFLNRLESHFGAAVIQACDVVGNDFIVYAHSSSSLLTDIIANISIATGRNSFALAERRVQAV